MKAITCSVFLALLATFPLMSFSEDRVPGITGFWHIVDDSLGKARSKIRFTKDKAGVFSGVLVSLAHPESKDLFPRCSACQGALANKPLVGMTIIKGLKMKGNKWTSGTILNPDTGKIHKLTVKLIEKDRLKVSSSFFKPYNGSEILGKSLIWER